MGWLPYITVLIIPTGATSGRRIVIDGTNGQIVMYDSNNQPVITESATDGTIAIKSADGRSIMIVGRVYDPVFTDSVPGISWHSTSPPSAAPGAISLSYRPGPTAEPTGYAEMTPARMSGDASGTGKISFTVDYLQNDGNVVADSWWFWGEAGGAQTLKTAEPTYVTDGNFHLFGAEWASVTTIVPPSATIDIDIYMTGHNAGSAGATLAAGVQIDLTSPLTLLQAANLASSAYITAPFAASTGNQQAYARITVGSSVLGGYIGQQIRITPAYRSTSGSGAANVSVSTGRIVVRPATYGI